MPLKKKPTKTNRGLDKSFERGKHDDKSVEVCGECFQTYRRYLARQLRGINVAHL